MKFDYKKLLKKIVDTFGTQLEFSSAIGLSERSLSLKLNNKVPWKNTEIMNAVQLLGIEENEIHEYFFKLKVQTFEQKELQGV